MTQQQINDFRRRLQQGDAVRVVNGEVTLAGSPHNSTTNGKPNAGGVQVKPHEWGARTPNGTGGGR